MSNARRTAVESKSNRSKRVRGLFQTLATHRVSSMRQLKIPTY